MRLQKRPAKEARKRGLKKRPAKEARKRGLKKRPAKECCKRVLEKRRAKRSGAGGNTGEGEVQGLPTMVEIPVTPRTVKKPHVYGTANSPCKRDP